MQDYLSPKNSAPALDFKTDADFAIKILDKMIQVEEDVNNGFSIYNRGQTLKTSLIDPTKVASFLKET